MSFEQPVYSFYSGGEPPTPDTTPTSPNFFLNSFQTPKQDSRSHGPFSPWTPTFASATALDFKTPTRPSFATPSKSPTKPSRPTTGQKFEAEIASHVHHLSPNPCLPLPPVDPGRQLSSSPNPSQTTERKRPRLDTTGDINHEDNSAQEANTSMNSAGSMQTPPPTSTSASRRKAQQAQVARLVKGSAEKGGLRMPFPTLAAKPANMELSTSGFEESPQQYADLQFSPEGFGFPLSTGPATAPVYPQHKLFWDPEQSGDTTMDMNFTMDDTFSAFGLGVQKHLDPFVSSHDQPTGLHFPTSPAFDLIGTRSDSLAPFPSSGVERAPSRTASSVTLARKSSQGHGVNPSLLFSSPNRAATEASSMPVGSQTIQDDNLRPYAHQLRDAQVEMELEMQNARKPKRKRGLENGDSPAVQAAVQTLREDRTDNFESMRDTLEIVEATNGRSNSRNSSGSSKGRHATGQIPLRRQRSKVQIHRPASVPQPHKRTSVTLTIDASGRAKTETKVMGSNVESSLHMDVDDQDSGDSSSSSGAEMILSRPQSFAYAPPKQKLPPIGRFANQPKSHSQKSSYASTLGSGSTAHTLSEASNRRGSSNLYMQSNAYPPQVEINSGAAEEAESEAETIVDSDEDRGDAQSALKKVLRTRSQKKVPKRAMWPAQNKVLPDQRRTYPSRGTTGGPYFTTENLTPTHLGYNDPFSNISPTTITDPDLATPSTAHSNISSDSIRCLCHTTNDDGQLMIQW